MTLELRTNDKPDIKKVWPYDTVLQYTVTLTPNELKSELKVHYVEGEGEMPSTRCCIRISSCPTPPRLPYRG